jgi:RNA polymerase-binding transcription factor DksA
MENKEVKEEVRDFDYYHCEKCDTEVSFTFVLKFIKDSKLCATCYYEHS